MLNPMQYNHIAATGVKVIHSRACVLGSINVNTFATGAILTIYNGSSTTGNADIIAIVDCGTTSTASKGELQFNVNCPLGLTINLATAAADITIGSEGPGV